MQSRSILKNRKTKKQLRNKLSQRGGSNRASGRASGRGSSNGSRASSGDSNMPMPNAFFRLQEEIEQTRLAESFPPVPTPRIKITVSVEELQALKNIFTTSPSLDNLISSYTQMHQKLKTFKPIFIKTELLKANTVFARMIKLLQDKYIHARSVTAEHALIADKWCDYIQKLIESNQKNIMEIEAFKA